MSKEQYYKPSAKAEDEKPGGRSDTPSREDSKADSKGDVTPRAEDKTPQYKTSSSGRKLITLDDCKEGGEYFHAAISRSSGGLTEEIGDNEINLPQISLGRGPVDMARLSFRGLHPGTPTSDFGENDFDW